MGDNGDVESRDHVRTHNPRCSNDNLIDVAAGKQAECSLVEVLDREAGSSLCIHSLRNKESSSNRDNTTSKQQTTASSSSKQ